MNLAILFGLLLSSSHISAGAPGPDQRNAYYLTNRAPLAAAPYVELPPGAVVPGGWVGEMLRRQRDGLCGHLGEVSAWLKKDGNAWLSKDGKGDFGWEEVPYWLRGYCDLGYILNDPKLIAESKLWIDAVLSSQKENGDFGPVLVDDHGVEDFWPKMLMLCVLQTYYEYSHDGRVAPFMARYFKYELAYPEDKFLKQYWENRRGGDNLYSVFWLYNMTGEPWLLDLARKVHRCTVSWKVDPQKATTDWFAAFPDWHNVNIAEGFREPATYSVLSHDKTDLHETIDDFTYVRQYFGQVPGGMFGADENARKGHDDPHQAVETCGMVEQMNSDELLFRETGMSEWLDNAEDVAFNTYPAALMPDLKSLRYLTSPNMVVSDDKSHSPDLDNGGPFLMMNPFSSRCCQHNHSMGWPYYAQNMWMATGDNGLIAALYGESAVTAKVQGGKKVSFEEKTHYPFSEEVVLRLHAKTPATFPLYLRVPQFAQETGPQVWVNGKLIASPDAAKSLSEIKLQRTWHEGDTVRLRIPMSIRVERWDKNKDSATVAYGPLEFSLMIHERYVMERSDATAISDSKWQKGADPAKWPSYKIEPTTPWNYALLLKDMKVVHRPWPKSNYPFTLDEVPIEITAIGRRLPSWTIDKDGLCDVVPPSPVQTKAPIERLTLVPMGAARLRISAFPVAED